MPTQPYESCSLRQCTQPSIATQHSESWYHSHIPVHQHSPEPIHTAESESHIQQSDRCVRRLNIECFESECIISFRISPLHELMRGWCGVQHKMVRGQEVWQQAMSAQGIMQTKWIRINYIGLVLYPFGKEPNQKKYPSATVQSLERNVTQSFDNIWLVVSVHFDVTLLWHVTCDNDVEVAKPEQTAWSATPTSTHFPALMPHASASLRGINFSVTSAERNFVPLPTLFLAPTPFFVSLPNASYSILRHNVCLT